MSGIRQTALFSAPGWPVKVIEGCTRVLVCDQFLCDGLSVMQISFCLCHLSSWCHPSYGRLLLVTCHRLRDFSLLYRPDGIWYYITNILVYTCKASSCMYACNCHIYMYILMICKSLEGVSLRKKCQNISTVTVVPNCASSLLHNNIYNISFFEGSSQSASQPAWRRESLSLSGVYI